MVLTLLKSLMLVGVLLGCVAYAVLVERRVVARIQTRMGPNRVGFGILSTLPIIGRLFGFLRYWKFSGLGQPIADGIKLFLKEDIEPANAYRWPYRLAPIISILPAVMGFAVIPFGPDIELLGRNVKLHVASLRLDILYLLALGSLGTYGVILAGWSSNSKYSLLGSLRATAQLISYELPLGLALLSAVIYTKTISLGEAVEFQLANGWLIFSQPLAFLIVAVAALAEANRSPFDLPEAESELVAGYFTEYSGMRMALFFLGEYMHLFLAGSLITALFLGGWSVPFFGAAPWWLGVISFCVKVGAFLFICMWTRSTLPRLRYDHLMHFSWKGLIPLAAINLVATAVWAALL